jgi:hypothetical protein
MDMRFGMWNVISMYRASSLVTVSKYKFDLVGVQEVRWEGSDTEPVGEYTFSFMKKGNENQELTNYMELNTNRETTRC